MRNIYMAILSLMLVTGCTAKQEAHFVDQEFGAAHREVLRKQIAYPEKQCIDVAPAGMEGIDAEQAMTILNSGFGKEDSNCDSLTIDFSK